MKEKRGGGGGQKTSVYLECLYFNSSRLRESGGRKKTQTRRKNRLLMGWQIERWSRGGIKQREKKKDTVWKSEIEEIKVLLTCCAMLNHCDSWTHPNYCCLACGLPDEGVAHNSPLHNKKSEVQLKHDGQAFDCFAWTLFLEWYRSTRQTTTSENYIPQLLAFIWTLMAQNNYFARNTLA